MVHNHLFCTDWISHNWGPVLWPALRQHIVLAVVAVAIGFAISMTLALAAHRYGLFERPTLFVTTFLYTIPSLALPAIVAGLRIAIVTIIALATIVYTIYDAGLGVPIHTALGEGPFKTELIAAGGLAILLALAADGLLVLAQRALTPWARARVD